MSYPRRNQKGFKNRSELLPIGTLLNERNIELGLTEQEFARLSCEHGRFSHIYFMVRLQGPPVRKNDVERALKALQQLHPILRCALTKNKEGKYELIESEKVFIPVIEKPRMDDSSWKIPYEAEVNNVNTQLNYSPNSVFLFQSKTSNIIDIAFSLQHFLCDGTSLTFLAHQLLDYLFEGFKYYPSFPVGQHSVDMETLVDGILNMQKQSWLGKAIYMGLTVKTLYTGSLWKRFPPDESIINLTKQTLFSTKELFRKERSFCSSFFFEDADTETLVRLCKLKNTTVTSIIAASMFIAVAELTMKYEPGVSTFSQVCSCVTDLRKLPSANNQIPPNILCPYVGSFLVKIPSYDWKNLRDEDIWKIANEFREQQQSQVF